MEEAFVDDFFAQICFLRADEAVKVRDLRAFKKCYVRSVAVEPDSHYEVMVSNGNGEVFTINCDSFS